VIGWLTSQARALAFNQKDFDAASKYLGNRKFGGRAGMSPAAAVAAGSTAVTTARG
jgi:hypothetical protein